MTYWQRHCALKAIDRLYYNWWTGLTADEIVSVQPMTAPVSRIFFMKFTYGVDAKK